MSSTLLERVVALLAPLECHICEVEGFMLCLNCQQTELSEQESRCYLCNKLTTSNRVCRSCTSRSRLRRVWWLGSYSKTVKELIHQLKYNRKRAYANEFGALLADSIPYVPEDTIIVPAPTASARIRARGYDQAVLLAKRFALHRNLPYKEVLRRNSQADQIGKRRTERLKQMENSFSVINPRQVKGKNILLIDDVLTTGATLEAAATVLRSAGAKHVDAVVVARHLLG